MNKPGCHRTGLDAHFGVDTSMLRNASRNWPGIGGADAAPEPLALLVDNADRGRLLRYVQPNIMRHRNLRWCKSPGKMPGSRHYRLLGFEPRLPEVHRCCTDRRCGRIEPDPCSGSCDTDVLRASQLQHSVQHVGCDGLGRLSLVRLAAQPLT